MLGTIAWQIGGEQGQGLDSTADVFARVCNRLGYWVYSYKTFQSRIKGGHTDFTVRVALDPVGAPVPRVDLLVAMDQESIDLLADRLTARGLLLADAAFQPVAPDGVDLIAIDMMGAAREVGGPIFKNSIALGASAALLGIPLDGFKSYMEEKFGRKGRETVAANWTALERGAAAAREAAGSRALHLAPPAAPEQERLLLTGNEATALGALYGGCRAVFAYPITPASEVLEVSTRVQPEFGGVAVQMEDELSALMAAIGAGFAGVRAMTATAGPGLSLMQENIGLAAMAEIPVVIVDTQRGGPSTGMPTKLEQSDLFALAHGTHGDAPRIILAPGDARQIFGDIQLAFNLAENYHCPVLVASDLGISEWQQTVDPGELTFLPIDRGPMADVADLLQAGRDAFQRYRESASGVSPRSLPGMPNGQYLASGAEHGPTGKVTENPANRRRMMERRLGKLRRLELGGKPVPGLEVSGDDEPDALLITLGSLTGAAREAAADLRAAGLRVQVAQVRVIAPMPVDELQTLIDRARQAFVIEQNAQGQLAFLMRGEGVRGAPRSILRYDGTLFTGDEMAQQVRAALREEATV